MPRSLRGTAFWTAMSIGTIESPIPIPPKRASRTAPRGVSPASHRARSRNESVSDAMPAMTTVR
jgi:hypothetical protein